jgi:polysaccharide biosynthesis protein PslH
MVKKILVISPTPSHPQTQGNRQRIYTLLINLKELGHQVYFAHIKKDKGDQGAMQQCWGERFYSLSYEMPAATIQKRQLSSNKIIKLFQKAERKLRAIVGNNPYYTFLIDEWYDESVDEALISLAESLSPDIVIIEYVFFSKALECFGKNTLKIIDTHDIFANRYKLFSEEQLKNSWFSTTKRQEDLGLSRADIIVAIQAKEANALKKRLNKKVVTVGHPVSLFESKPRSLKNKILFLGSMNAINIASMNYLIKDIFPLVKSEFRDAKLVLAGGICDQVTDFDSCLKLGTPDSLDDVYDLADIVVNPVLFGTGLKIKNIEAMGYAKPLVTTALGAEGMEAGSGKSFLIAESAQEFAASILEIFLKAEVYENLSRNAYKFAKEWNENCLKSLRDAIETEVEQQ